MAMRQVLVNHAYTKMANKRGGGQIKLSLDDVDLAVAEEAEEVLAVHEALMRLQQFDARKSRAGIHFQARHRWMCMRQSSVERRRLLPR